MLVDCGVLKSREAWAYSDLALDSDGELLVQPNANSSILENVSILILVFPVACGNAGSA